LEIRSGKVTYRIRRAARGQRDPAARGEMGQLLT